MRLRKFITGLCLIALLTACFSQSALAETKISETQVKDRQDFIDNNIRKLGGKGQDALDDFFSKNGIVKADTITPVTPMSAPGSVNLSVNAWYDRYSNKYVVQGSWQWIDLSVVDLSSGALDGVSLSMCQTNWDAATGYVFSSNPARIAVYDNFGTEYINAGGASTISKSGIAYTFQDSWVNAYSYCGYHGVAWFYLDKVPTQLPLYIKMDFQHTWSSASLSSFGISWPTNSAPTLSMQFSTVPKNFQRSQQITLSNWPNLF
jgi:hypothetical protein